MNLLINIKIQGTKQKEIHIEMLFLAVAEAAATAATAAAGAATTDVPLSGLLEFQVNYTLESMKNKVYNFFNFINNIILIYIIIHFFC
jgi:hypothetical protein